MKRIIIIGSGGAGKSTFSKRLHEITGIELFHLDKLYWKPNWEETAKPEMLEIIKNLLKGDSWILDGNFNSTMELRMEASDTIIFFDMPRYLCLYQILKRWKSYWKTNRPDMPSGCNEKIDLKFLHWVWTFPKNVKPIIEQRIKRTDKGKNIIRLKSRKDVEKFISNVKQMK